MTDALDPGSDGLELAEGRVIDPMGTRALYTQPKVEPPALGSVTIACSGCDEESIVGISRAARLLFGSVSLPLIRGDYPTLLRCPACHHRSWVRLSIRL